MSELREKLLNIFSNLDVGATWRIHAIEALIKDREEKFIKEYTNNGMFMPAEQHFKLIEKNNKEWSEQIQRAIIKELEECSNMVKERPDLKWKIDQRLSQLRGGKEQ